MNLPGVYDIIPRERPAGGWAWFKWAFLGNDRDGACGEKSHPDSGWYQLHHGEVSWRVWFLWWTRNFASNYCQIVRGYDGEWFGWCNDGKGETWRPQQEPFAYPETRVLGVKKNGEVQDRRGRCKRGPKWERYFGTKPDGTWGAAFRRSKSPPM